MRFHVVGMKEPDYVMMIMTTYGTLAEFGDKKRHYMVNGVKHVTTFRYPEVVYNHYRYCDVIDNRNSFRMHLLSMEETWMTMLWPNRVFCFLLTITMVNVQNAATYFLNKPKMESLQSRRLIAKSTINISGLVQPPESVENDDQSNTHSLWFPHTKDLFTGD